MRNSFLKTLAVTALLAGAGVLNSFGQFTTTTQIGGGALGSITVNSPGSYTVVGGGNDIWDAGDEFTFHYAPVSGDFDVKNRVESLDPVARWTKGGLMLRESTAGASRMAFPRVTPADVATSNGGNGANDNRFAYRTGKTDAGPNGGQHEDGGAVNSPAYPNAWLRLQRQGNIIRAYAGTDGLNWSQMGGDQDTATWQVGGVNTAFAANALLGLAVSRHSGSSATATAEFRNFMDVTSLPVAITAQPQSITVVEGAPASFTVGLNGFYNPLWTFQWFSNTVAIPGATARQLTFASATRDLDGLQFRVAVSDGGAPVTSANAQLTVTFDAIPPTLVSANSVGNPTSFDLVYSETVNAADAVNLANYSVSGGVTLSAAVLQGDNKTVRFTSSTLTAGKVLTVSNVRDRASTPNPILAGSTIPIIYAEGSIRRHFWKYTGGGGSAHCP